MKLEDPPRERRRFELIGAAMAAVIAATTIGFFTFVIVASNDDSDPPQPTATPSASPTPTPDPVEGARLLGPADLRSAPSADVAIVTRVAETEAIHVFGRTSDGAWLAVGLADRPGVTGWLPADAVTGLEADGLPIVEGPGGTSPDGGGPLSPDLPDLIVTRVYSLSNRLWVEIMNQGAGDATGVFRISIDGGSPVALGAKPGEPLRPGQAVGSEIPGFYLQLRTAMTVVIEPEDDREEEDPANNTWEGIIGPDTANDIEIVDATAEGPDGHLVVTIRNNSPIPIAGTFTVSVRETPPSTELIGRQRTTVEIVSGGTETLDFEEITEIDMTRVSVILSTDAIDDAILANNSFPR